MIERDNRAGRKHVCLLGASFDTGNLGVSALAESAIMCILHRWPEAVITLLDSGKVCCSQKVIIGGREIVIEKLPIRFCKNIFLPNHFMVLAFHTFWRRIVRSIGSERSRGGNECLERILQADMVADITGGDSFSDIYGMRRFVIGFLRKWLIIQFGKKLVMLPQTYGPFRKRIARAMATYILGHASVVCARDRTSAEYAERLLKQRGTSPKVRFCPDVAFALPPRQPVDLDVGTLEQVRNEQSVVVGLNISGLLFNGGYNRNNMFALKVDYRKLIYDVLDQLMEDARILVLLVPHVLCPPGHVESDVDACRLVYDDAVLRHPGRIFMLNGGYGPGEAKFMIGKCDFFIGSRMHSCIAAMSLAVPTVGLAYSMKFKGVFESVEMDRFVVDMSQADEEKVLGTIKDALASRDATRKQLGRIIPAIRQNSLEVLEAVP